MNIYKCNHCGETDANQFTRRITTACRKCRAKKSKDVHFLEFKTAVEQQELLNKYWKVRV